MFKKTFKTNRLSVNCNNYQPLRNKHVHLGPEPKKKANILNETQIKSCIARFNACTVYTLSRYEQRQRWRTTFSNVDTATDVPACSLLVRRRRRSVRRGWHSTASKCEVCSAPRKDMLVCVICWIQVIIRNILTNVSANYLSVIVQSLHFLSVTPSCSVLQCLVLHFQRPRSEFCCPAGVWPSTARPRHWSAVQPALTAGPRRIEFKLCVTVYKSFNGIAPSYITDMLQPVATLQRTTITNNNLVVPCARLRFSERALISVAAPRLWSGTVCLLTPETRNAAKLHTFKKKLKTFLFYKHF